MKALTLHRPWTTLVMRGDKPIENRPWRTTYRGWLLIHGGQTWDEEAIGTAERWGYGLSMFHENHPTGILGGVYLEDVCDAAAGSMPYRPCDCGQWAMPGQYHWKIGQPIVFRRPLECRGWQGLWEAPMMAAIRFESVR